MKSEDEIMDWMRTRVQTGEFNDAASLAQEFLQQNDIHDVLDPDFQRVMDAGFKLAGEIAHAQPA
ncbi:MAG: hypothetical protein ACYSUT_03180 [Planctomycetota bacterium]|jgi:hypothetical protein